MADKITVHYKQPGPGGRKFSKVSQGADRAAALALANARTNMTVAAGTPVGNESIAVPGTDLTGVPASGSWEDAVFEILIGGQVHTFQEQNVTTAIELAGSDGLIDPANALVTAYATARGGTFVSGYIKR